MTQIAMFVLMNKDIPQLLGQITHITEVGSFTKIEIVYTQNYFQKHLLGLKIELESKYLD